MKFWSFVQMYQGLFFSWAWDRVPGSQPSALCPQGSCGRPVCSPSSPTFPKTHLGSSLYVLPSVEACTVGESTAWAPVTSGVAVWVCPTWVWLCTHGRVLWVPWSRGFVHPLLWSCWLGACVEWEQGCSTPGLWTMSFPGTGAVKLDIYWAFAVCTVLL